MATPTSYNLVHIITSGEYKTPLVASQVFDRAQAQATISGAGKPASVSVWIIVPMREVFDKAAKNTVASLQQRCPAIKIHLIGCISRLGNWPAIPTIKKLRRSLKGKTVYHCRGESSFEWADAARKSFPGDAIVIDIRGYWPLERLINGDVTDEKDMSAAQRIVYDSDVNRLKNIIAGSEWMCTVSEPLRRYMIDHCGASKDSVLIPCCVNNTIADTNRDKIRQELNLGNNTAILYLGGTQKYQCLEELVMPFMRSALTVSDNTIAVFITQNKDKMTGLLTQFGIDMNRVRMLSVPQNKVADYLTAMDMGLLLRAASPLNNFSQPVKFGEYLSAGIPVVLEAGTGDIAGMLNEYNIGCVIQLEGKNTDTALNDEVQVALDWFHTNRQLARTNTRKFIEEQYTWQANVPKERSMYAASLELAGTAK
ncbi:MAG: hypothetical protein JWQ38_823 [Flavipsychrobacter sp.]|nr:hypothetical protein [Flavipsychrobacter sp.]